MGFSKRVLFCGSAAALVFSAATQAFAQAEPAGGAATLDEIVVTATRREENLQTVPVAVTALAGPQLQKSGITKTEELTRVTPSFTASRFIGRPDQVSFGIRGQRQGDERITNDGAVIPYLAEVPIARTNGLGINGFLDVKSVEVVKGPVGTLFGRNTTGGAVLITPNTPTDKFEGSARAAFGNLGYYSGDLIGNFPIAEGVGLRLALTAGHRDGYVDNRSSFRDPYGEKYFGGRGSFRVDRGDLVSTFYFDGLRFTGTGPAAEITAVNPSPRALINALFGTNFLQNALAEQQAAGLYSVRTAERTSARTEAFGISNTTTFNVTDTVLFKNIIGYRTMRSNSYVDNSDSTRILVNSGVPGTSHQVTEEFQAQYNTKRLQLIGGGFFFDERGFNGGYTLVGGPLVATLFDEHAHNRAYSLFAEGTYGVTDQLFLTVGARYSWDERRYAPSIYQDFSGSTTPNHTRCVTTDDAGRPVAGCRAHASADFDRPTFNITGRYQFNPDHQAYASFRTGYRTGGFGTGSQSAAQRVPYNPETVTNYEVGYKGQTHIGEAALRLNLAGYYSDYKNIQRNVNACIGNPCTLVTRVQNAAAATIKGFEAESTLKFSENLELSAFYSYIDAKFDKYISADPATGLPVDRSDQPFGYLPKHKVGATVNYGIDLPSDQRLVLIANVAYQSSQILADQVGLGLTQKGYALTNLRADWEIKPNLVASLWARNVFDQNYAVGGVNVYDSLGYNFVYPGEPKTYGVELNVKF